MAGAPAATVSRADLVERVSTALDGFTVTQHISPNHVIEFDPSDPDRATCYSYMYAQHLLRGSANGEFYLLRGSYANYMRRTEDGWRIERIIQHRSWEDGNTRRRRRSHRPLPGIGTAGQPHNDALRTGLAPAQPRQAL